jgi:hypothetical protein
MPWVAGKIPHWAKTPSLSSKRRVADGVEDVRGHTGIAHRHGAMTSRAASQYHPALGACR